MGILQEQISAIHGARTRSRPPRMVEVQVLQEQKPALRVTVSASSSRPISLAVNGTAVKVDVSLI